MLGQLSHDVGNFRWAISCVGACLVVSLLSLSVTAGQFNPTLNVGDIVPAWPKLPGADGREYAWDDFKDKQLLVVVFTCNSCPYAVDYEDRLNRLAQKYSAADSAVGVVAINANRIEADQLPAMKQRATEKGFTFPYLWDESQQIPRSFGAARTPEFFVLDSSRRILYMGAMDDNTQAAGVQRQYVQEAIDAHLKQQPLQVAETAPVGCAIRYVRERKKPAQP